MSRKVLDDPEIQERILENLRRCPFVKPACWEAGVHPQRFFEWRKRVEAGDPEAQHLADFFIACQQAVASLEIDMVDKVVNQPRGTRGKMWLLQRWRPDRYGFKAAALNAPDIPQPPKPIEEMNEVELTTYVQLLQHWLFGKLNVRQELSRGQPPALELGADAPSEEE